MNIAFYSTGYNFYSGNGNFSSNLSSNKFTTPSSGSVYINLAILTKALQMQFRLETEDMIYDLGYAESGETHACFDLPSSVVGTLVVRGRLVSPVSSYNRVANIYEIKVNQKKICPSKLFIKPTLWCYNNT